MTREHSLSLDSNNHEYTTQSNELHFIKPQTLNLAYIILINKHAS